MNLKKHFSFLLIVVLIVSISSSSFVEAANTTPNPIKIVIDPGHGGSDSGAIGVNGIYEKNVNLDISLRVKALLHAAGYQVIMTREDDNTLKPYKTTAEKRADLQARVDVATNVKADLFVSVHSNSFKADSKGTLVLYYDPSNYDPNYAGTVQMRNWSNESKAVATSVLHSITSNLGLHDLGVVPSNVYVVRSGTVPSILVETAFLSNWEEATKLADSSFRQAMAESIAEGIMAYLPPRYMDIRDHWAKNEIATLSYQGIINGYQNGMFKPEQAMTRVEWIALLDRAIGFLNDNDEMVEIPEDNVDPEETVDENRDGSIDDTVEQIVITSFADVPVGHWAYESVMNAVSAGIINGYPDGTFRPNGILHREEMAVILNRTLSNVTETNEDTEQNTAVGLHSEENMSVQNDRKADAMITAVISALFDAETTTAVSYFYDVPNNHWASQEIMELYEKGIINGIKEHTFGFGKNVTRAEAAMLIYRILFASNM